MRLKSKVVFTPWKKTGFPAALNARPERTPSSLPVSPPLGTPVVESRRPAVGVKRELTVTPLDVSSLSVWVLASNRTVSPPVVLVVPAVSVVVVVPAVSLVVVVVLVVEPVAPGTKKEALPVVRPPVTEISA